MFIESNEVKFSEKGFTTNKKEYKLEGEVNFNQDKVNFDNRASVEFSEPDLVETSNGIESNV